MHGIARKPIETTDIDAIQRKCRIIQHKRSAVFPALSVIDTPEWGSGGRWFESSRPDTRRGHSSGMMNVPFCFTFPFCFSGHRWPFRRSKRGHRRLRPPQRCEQGRSCRIHAASPRTRLPGSLGDIPAFRDADGRKTVVIRNQIFRGSSVASAEFRSHWLFSSCRHLHASQPGTPATKSSTAVLSSRLFFEISPSANASKVFFVKGMGVAAQGSYQIIRS